MKEWNMYHGSQIAKLLCVNSYSIAMLARYMVIAKLKRNPEFWFVGLVQIYFQPALLGPKENPAFYLSGFA